MSLVVQARAHARYAFSLLWRSHAMSVRGACTWLLRHFDVETVDELTVDECERLVVLVVRYWSERTANRCGTCRVPVRADHAHVICDSALYHLNCVPSPA